MRDVAFVNSGYARALLEEYLENPEAVPPEWRSLFESGDGELLASLPGLARLLRQLRPDGNGHATAPAPAVAPREAPAAPPDDELVAGVAAAMSLVKALRMHGHLAARLDPLGSEPVGDPALEPQRLQPELTPELQARIPARLLRVHAPGETLADVLPRLQETYSGTSAYEIEHISDHEQRIWLREAIESGRYHAPLSDDQKRRLLARLSEVEGLERYLRRVFLGQKQFSVEGLDAMIPMLDQAIERAAEGGAHEVVLGMAHRGRLNVLAHVIGRPYETILKEFEGERTLEALTADSEGGTGDVQYHLRAAGPRTAVVPGGGGGGGAEQTDRSTREGRHDPRVALPVLSHGDAAVPAQGIVAETLNLAELDGYATGGTLHLIANNQIGFTTDPVEGRSTRYSSDLAKGFDVPIIHVNADDAEAAISAIRLALAFRRRFEKDVVVDLIGYRRHGHNEQDEAAYTQPLMAEKIARHPSVREQFAAQLAEEGVVSDEEAEHVLQEVEAKLRAAHEGLRSALGGQAVREGHITRSSGAEVVPADADERLRALNAELLAVPEGFTVHPKLAKQLERRVAALDRGAIDWGQAEALAFGSLLVEGIPVRLTGQDTERGTFSHRHIALHDARTGEVYKPIQYLADAAASFEVHNSPLSELAAVGFEYGYSVAAPEALVLWEAQFGDFVNGAQIVVDQFMVSGLSKWRQTSRLTLLLPHGYEGQGPEHSSARMARFLHLAAEGNIRVVNCTTPAQYFHLLRRQAKRSRQRPLILFTPKSLLRHPLATSKLEDLTSGHFQAVLDDPYYARNPERAERL